MRHHHHQHGALEVAADFEHTAVLFAGPERPGEHTLTRVKLHVRNSGSHPIAFTFVTTQRIEIELVDNGGEVVSRWSDGRMFGQSAATEELAPHHSWIFEGELPIPASLRRSGDYTLRISLTADRRIGATGPLRLTYAP
jgi:Intracellular proteinase inhibitor